MADDDGTGVVESPPQIEPYRPFPTFAEWAQTVVDSTAFDLFSSQLDVTRSNTDGAMLADAVRTATKWAAVNTGAIEGLFEIDRGFTYSIAVSAAAWSEIREIKGDTAANSIDDAIRAYDFVLDAATHSYPVTETWIRDLHSIVTASQDTYTVLTPAGLQEQKMPKGVYKTQPNSPLNFATNVVHSYATPTDTAPEMARLVAEINGREFQFSHPTLQASYAHYAFVSVHPFADGNGRVSRALASTFLYRSPGVPLVIFADQKGDYIDALEGADRGDYAKFIRFVSERAIDTIGMVQAHLHSALIPDIETQLSELEPLLTGRGGLPHTEIDAIGHRLYDILSAAFREQIIRNPLSQGLTARAQRAGVSVGGRPEGYRPVPGSPAAVYLSMSSSAPAEASTTRAYAVSIAMPGTLGPDFVLYSEKGVILEVELREINPIVRSALTYRAEAQALREVREVLAETAAKATSALRKAGYLE